ncbi:MAG: InlB B-repeat-containing protein [Treponema sp.]|jgi:uncharacterized repeat protein (TIGR02543 family)|nr:InlB B-repeat-containing protein [Treponema sp.]
MKYKSLFMVIASLALAGLLFTACKDDEESTKPTTYTVTFNTGEGGPTVAEATVNAGAKVSKPANPEKDDFNFGGWFKEAELTTEWNFTNDTVTENTTLYAKWTWVYTLSTNSTLLPAGLSIESAIKNKTTGVTTVVLNGTIDHGIPTGLVADFLGSATFPTEGVPTKYSAFTIKGLVLGTGVRIKQTNNSFILYKDFPDKGQAVETNGTYVKDKTYPTDPNDTDGGFNIIFAEGVTPETAKLEITPAGGTEYTVVIDWSKVTFR